MEIDTIKLGEIYPISVSALDADGAVIAMDETWSVACTVTSCCVGGEKVADIPITIADGVGTGSIDSGAVLKVGTFYYDIRITNADSKPYWSEPVKLIVQTRNTATT